MDRPEIILAPGPTPIPPEVLLAQGSPLVYHRGPGFGNLMRDVTDAAEGALPDRRRRRAADDLVSGTGGLESAIQNCFSPGDEVFVPLAGFFAERCKRLAEAYGLTVRTVDYEWGTKIRPDDVAAALAEHPVKAVLLTQSETSTGVIQPIEQLARVANDAGAMVVVDVVSSLGAVPFDFDGWGIDVAVGGIAEGAVAPRPASRSCAISERAWEAVAHRDEPAVLLRLGDLPAVRRAAAPREPVDAGDQRDAGTAGRARAVLPGRRRGGDGSPPDRSRAR